MANELTLPERAKAALNSAEHEKVLVTLAKSTTDIAEIKDSDGRAQVHGAYMVLKTRRGDIRKAGKDARDDATKFSKAIIAEEDRLVALIEPEETRLQTLRDAWDQAREQERREKAQAEANRIAATRAMIDDLRNIPVGLIDGTPDQLATAIAHVDEYEVTADVFAEFVDAAHAARAEVVGKLKGMHDAAVRRAEQEAELASVRAKLDQERAEQAERDRRAAAARVEQERIDRARREAEEARARAEREAEQRKIDEQRAELERQQAAINAERQRIADEAAARARAEAEAEAEKKRQAEAAARAEAERIRQEQEAAAVEAKRLKRAEFEQNGPEPSEIIDALAERFFVSQETALNWLNLHAWAHVDLGVTA